MEDDSSSPTATNEVTPVSLISSEAKIAILLKAKNLHKIDGFADGKVAVSIAARVGIKDSTWEEKGSNDGAVSDPLFVSFEKEPGKDMPTPNIKPEEATIAMGWLVLDPFHRSKTSTMEAMVRLMIGPKTKVVGKDIAVFDQLVGLTVAGELCVDLRDLTFFEKLPTKQVMEVGIDITLGRPRIAQEAIDKQTISSVVPRSYPCGTNHFGMLPDGISFLSKKEFDNCTVWGEAHEPMRTWVAIHLLHHHTPFKTDGLYVRSPVPPIPGQKDWKGEVIQPTPKQTNWKDEQVPSHIHGAKSGYGCTQPPDNIQANAVPMVETSSGKVIADGVIINYLMIPALYGPDALTPDVLRWERRIGYDYIPSIWRDMKGYDYVYKYQRTAPNYPSAMNSRWSPVMRWPFLVGQKVMLSEIQKIKSYIGEEYNSDDEYNIKDIMKEFKWELRATNQHFMGTGKGSSEPGPIDLSFYGINILFYMIDIGGIKRLMHKHGLKDWMERMLAIPSIQPKRCLSMDFFGPSMDGFKGGWLMDDPQLDPVPLTPPTEFGQPGDDSNEQEKSKKSSKKDKKKKDKKKKQSD